MIVGKLWRAFRAQINKIANFFWTADPIAQMQYEYDCFFFIADYHSLTTHPTQHDFHENVKQVIIEYLALGRLAHAMLRTPLRPTLAAIAVPFIAADAISLINPQRFYDDLLRPSLVALFLSQLR